MVSLAPQGKLTDDIFYIFVYPQIKLYSLFIFITVFIDSIRIYFSKFCKHTKTSFNFTCVNLKCSTLDIVTYEISLLLGKQIIEKSIEKHLKFVNLRMDIYIKNYCLHVH